MTPFIDLNPVFTRHRSEYEQAVGRVFARGQYILGPELDRFEEEFAAFQGGGYAVGVANGTDAIELALRAAGIGSGDEVITAANTCVATVCAIERAGARVVLVDVDERTYTMGAAAARAAITPRTCALVPVHLYGRPADLTALGDLAQRASLLLVEDCAQAHGALWDGRPVGTYGALGAFSFYPTKNLGAFGDAGAIFTPDADLANRARRLRNYGQVRRDDHIERGINSRLDELQAALLRVNLRYLNAHNAERSQIAADYLKRLRGVVVPAACPDGSRAVHHLFVVRHADRDGLRHYLRSHGIETAVHYPRPVHLQPAYAGLNQPAGSLPVAERLAGEILSLPLYPGLAADDIDRVIDAVNHYQFTRVAA
jgi:dTDP-4-amino-4,6-dideoxygalactose transaminase